MMNKNSGSTSQMCIEQAVKFIERIGADGKSCYVHCKVKNFPKILSTRVYASRAVPRKKFSEEELYRIFYA